MAQYLILPRLGQTMQRGKVSRWLVKEGDLISEGQDIFELESDKLANVETASCSGVLRKILVPAGIEVPILTHVAIVGEASEDISAMLEESNAAPEKKEPEKSAEQAEKAPADNAAPPKRIAASPRAKKIAKEKGIDLALVTGTGPGGRITEEDVENYLKAPKESAKEPAPAAEKEPAEEKVKATPLTQKAAAALGIDLNAFRKADRIVGEDLLALLKEALAGAPAGIQSAGELSETVKPMNGMRKAIATNMLRSVQTSPMVTYTISAEMTNLKNFRDQLKANGFKVSYTDILVKFVSQALKDYPVLNSSIEGDSIIYKNYINMGVAVALEGGLIVPNIKNADQKSLTEISDILKDLADKARNGGLTMDDYTGGTFTITNLGMYGMESFTPIINQPEVAILGVNSMVDRPVFDEQGALVRKTFLPLSLTADHRAVDGAVAAQFLHRLKVLLENPALLLV